MANSGYGQLEPEDGYSDFNNISFIANQVLNRISTAKVVKVVKVTNNGDVSPVGFVDVQILVNQIDGQGNATPHGIIHNLPYFRLQGGANAIIIDPQVGDIGISVMADRDISAVKQNKDQANPGSFRKFDAADGIYIGGILNGTPTQYIQYTQTGINIKSTNPVNITSPTVTINGDLHATGAVIAGFGGGDQVGLQTHKHSGVQTGSGNTSSPTAGT
jgi:hypothetical protein